MQIKTVVNLFVSIFMVTKLMDAQSSNFLNSQKINNTPKVLVAPKPPMGLNSWDDFGLDITEEEFKQQVDFVAANLKQYGYEYMVIDAGWYAPHLSAVNTSPYFHGRMTKYETNVDEMVAGSQLLINFLQRLMEASNPSPIMCIAKD